MILERQLRKLSVGRRMGVILILLLLPLAALSMASVVVLNRQEIAFRDAVEESIHTLLPLTTLEHYLESALVDELEAQTRETVPDFATLTDSIDKSFANIESSGYATDLPEATVVSAQQAWRDARPSVQLLVGHVQSLHPKQDAAAETRTREDLQLAIRDISQARQQLSRAVEARYARAVATRHEQLNWLVASWVITLSFAALMIGAFLHSLLGPIKILGKAARGLAAGDVGVRSPVIGNDELTTLAECFNEMAAYWETSRQTLMTEAAQDPLTGALNRRGILALLAAELGKHAHRQQPVSIFMVDLDRFKSINDRFGHSAGDRALIWVVSKMHEMLRENDRLGRYGGDEFMIILPGASKQQAQHIAHRMAASIGEAAAREAACPAISIGAASAPDDGRDAASLIEAADRALYDSKERRRAGSPPVD